MSVCLYITQLEKARFIKVNELKLTQDELFSFFHANMQTFMYFKYQFHNLCDVPDISTLLIRVFILKNITTHAF